MAKTPVGGANPRETKAQILERAEREKVKFMRLQFTDILGTIKNVEIPDRQFEEALDGKIMFDGSSIEGFVRIEESDMYLRPDLATFRVFPWAGTTGEKVARMICDIYTPDGEPFVGDPRVCLKKVIGMAAAKGFAMNAGPEAEFFLFQTKDGVPTTETHDSASYFDLSPVDQGEDVRREIVLALEAMGFHVEAAHHEVAPGQHEIDFRYDDVLTTADSISTFRFVVKNIAIRNGLHATFMPKPIYGINGSGMHTHMSLFSGVAKKIDPGPPINKNIYKMSHRERRHLRIDELPGNLSEALDELEKDDLVRETLGDHLFEHFVAAKREEWFDYIKHVSPWETERYLEMY